MILDPYLTSYTKINSNWVKDLHVRPKSIKFIKENSVNPYELGWGSGFIDVIPKAQGTEV